MSNELTVPQAIILNKIWEEIEKSTGVQVIKLTGAQAIKVSKILGEIQILICDNDLTKEEMKYLLKGLNMIVAEIKGGE